MARCDDCMKNPVYPGKKCCFNCARVGTDCEVWHNCGEDCPGWDRKGVTNADKIRSMTDDELAVVLIQVNDCGMSIPFCQNKPECNELLDKCKIPDEMCQRCMMDWLKQPAEDDC